MVKYIEVFAQRVCILGECRGPTVEFFALETGQHWEDPAPNEPLLLLSVRRRREPQVVPSCAPAPSGSFGPKEKRRATQNPKGPKRTKRSTWNCVGWCYITLANKPFNSVKNRNSWYSPFHKSVNR